MPAGTPTPLGAGAFGRNALGAGSGLPVPGQPALRITYVTVGPGIGLPISYTVEASTQPALSVFYWVAPAITAFSINGTLAPVPNRVDYAWPPMLGYDLQAVPVHQGYSSVVWTYDTLLDRDMATLMTLYDPSDPRVRITYPDEAGFWQQRDAMWQPPQLGTRTTVAHSNVVLTFTHLS